MSPVAVVKMDGQGRRGVKRPTVMPCHAPKLPRLDSTLAQSGRQLLHVSAAIKLHINAHCGCAD